MTINFKNIHTNSDLLKIIHSKALENYEWYENHPLVVLNRIKNSLRSGLYHYAILPVVEKVANEDMDYYSLVSETGYLIRIGKYNNVLSLFKSFPKNLDLDKINNEIISDSWMQKNDYKTIKDLIQGEFINGDLKDIGDKILSLLN